MNRKDKEQIVYRIIVRVSEGFAFINDKYLAQQRNSEGPDLAWIRSIYILFSFYFEILLKSVLVLSGSYQDKNELDFKLKKLGHKIDVICDKLGDIELKNLGIKKISLNSGEYKIETSNYTIYVKDFNDIRYDFIEHKVRNITKDEDLIIRDSLVGAYEILEKIKSKYSNQAF